MDFGGWSWFQGWSWFEALVLLGLLAAAAAYAIAVRVARDRGPWPVTRTIAWCTGLLSAGIASIGPLADAAHTSFTAHMAGHVIWGMLSPLLLVVASPLTLLLRALPVRHARSMTRTLRHPLVRALTHPVVAGILNIGGLWLLYATGLFTLMHESLAVYALVHVHLLLAGCLFTESIVCRSPNPHRASVTTRAVVLIAFIALHSILAKWLWAHPRPGVDLQEARAGAELMYYAGDAVDLVLIVLLLHGWYAAARPRPRRSPEATAAEGEAA